MLLRGEKGCSVVAPGWYDSPGEPGLLRWWDGNQWTASTQLRPGTQMAPVPQGQYPSSHVVATPSAVSAMPRMWRRGEESGVELQVGVGEIHWVVFSFDKFWGPLKIYVDGQPLVKSVQLFSMSLKKTYTFSIGAMERHEVSIIKTRKLFFAGFRPQLVQAFVDNQLVAQYDA